MRQITDVVAIEMGHKSDTNILSTYQLHVLNVQNYFPTIHKKNKQISLGC